MESPKLTPIQQQVIDLLHNNKAMDAAEVAAYINRGATYAAAILRGLVSLGYLIPSRDGRRHLYSLKSQYFIQVPPQAAKTAAIYSVGPVFGTLTEKGND